MRHQQEGEIWSIEQRSTLDGTPSRKETERVAGLTLEGRTFNSSKTRGRDKNEISGTGQSVN